MQKIRVRINDIRGLHLLPAARIAGLSWTLPATSVTVRRDREQADGRSVLGLVLLDAKEGNELEIEVEGPEEVRGAAALAELFDNGAGI